MPKTISTKKFDALVAKWKRQGIPNRVQIYKLRLLEKKLGPG